MSLYINETWVNATEGYGIGESGVYETYFNTPSEAYRALQKMYGRCTGRVYVGERRHVGWAFVKRERYEDSPETFLQETWVTLHSGPPTVTTNYNYIGG